ncbi:MAG: tetratricopeptide repeat protein [Bryobacteraceae bacterium]
MRETVFLTLAALVAFGGGLGAAFHFDDHALFADAAVTSAEGWREIWRIERTRPLTYLTFWANYRLGRRDPAGYHAVNLALHVAAAVLLRRVLARVIPGRAALIGAALFAIHPVQTEPVVYVFARATLLATLLSLGALESWLRGRHWAGVAWFTAALAAKEECVALPLVLLLLYLSISRNPAELKPIAAMFGIALAAGLRVVWATRSVEGAGFGSPISAADYFLTQGVVIWRYLRLLVFPWGFTVDPQIAIASPAAGALGWLALGAASAIALRRFGRAREGFWFIAGLALLLPSSSVFPAADLAADRRVYLPLVAWSAAAGLVARNWKTPALAAIGVVLALVSIARTQVWVKEETLWAEAVMRSPAKVRPRIQLARVSTPERALALLEEARRIEPASAEIAAETGRVHIARNDPAKALEAFGRAVALSPRDPKSYNNRGLALLMLGQRDAGVADLRRALELDPCQFGARLNLRQIGERVEASGCPDSDEQRAQLAATAP